MRRDLNPELNSNLLLLHDKFDTTQGPAMLVYNKLQNNLCLLHTVIMKTVPFRVVNVHEDCKWHYSTQLGTAALYLFCAYRMYLLRAVVFNLVWLCCTRIQCFLKKKMQIFNVKLISVLFLLLNKVSSVYRM